MAGPAAEYPELRDLLLVVLRRRRLIGALYGAAILVAIVWLLMATPQYRAAAKVLITTNRADISTSAARPTEFVRGQVSPAEVNSQIEVLRSRDLIEEVLEGLGLLPQDQPPEPSPQGVRALLAVPMTAARELYRGRHERKADDGADTARAQRVDKLLKALDTVAVKSSNVIEVAITWPDPVQARDIVNHLTAAYLERQSALQQVSQAESFFTRQSELLQQKLEQSEAALHGLRANAGTFAGQQDELHQRLN